jgi:hypothetical protein
MERKQMGGKYKLWGKKLGALIILILIGLFIVLPLLLFEYLGMKWFRLFEWILGKASQQGEAWIFPVLEKCKRTLMENVCKDDIG